ncbi:MAG: 2,5-furandicarboxylate decarboxylase 1 [Bacteroidia bacterium]|jgi:2,5-furandicarboxylate decarboxylase 1
MVEDDKWTRLGIDATVKLPRPDKFTRSTVEDVDLSAYEITGA